MSDRPLKFAIFGNEYQVRKSAPLQKVLSYLKERKAEVYIERDFHEFLSRERQLLMKVTGIFSSRDFQADYAISMGGDGTFLKAASQVGDKQIPIIGINTGRLGFLADILPSEIETALDSVYARDYKIEDHTVIQIQSAGEPITGYPYALNDIAVLKRDNASMITIRTHIDGELLVAYQADGLIIATPTGSTAYNLSNGGPIIMPQGNSLCITPVAPHSLNIRPIVINDTCEITLDVESRNHNFLVAIDGRSEKLQEGTHLTIRKAPYKVRIVKQKNQRYFSTLREKLMWGADNRQAHSNH